MPALPRNVAHRIGRNVEAIAVLAGAIAAWTFIPEDILLPVAGGLVAGAAGGVLAIRHYAGKLDPDEFRDRRDLLVEAGLLLAMVGLAAFIVLLLEFADWR